MKRNTAMPNYVKERIASVKASFIRDANKPAGYKLDAEEQLAVENVAKAELMQQWNREQMLIPPEEIENHFRAYIPDFPQVDPAEVQARMALRDRAREAYVNGEFQVAREYPEDTNIFRPRGEQYVIRYFSDEDRRKYFDLIAGAVPSAYENSGLPQEEIDRKIAENRKESYRLVLQNVIRAVEEGEKVLHEGMTDNELVDNYDKIAMPCGVIQEAVNLLNEAGRYGVTDYSRKTLDKYNKRATALMNVAADVPKRMAMLSDTYYPYVKLEALYNAPTQVLEDMKMTHATGSMSDLFPGIGDTPEFMQEMDNTLGLACDIAFGRSLSLPDKIAAELGFANSHRWDEACDILDKEGKVIPDLASMLTHLEKGEVVWSLRKDGSGNPEALLAEPTKPGQHMTVRVGREKVRNMRVLPEPKRPALGVGARIGNWFSMRFRGRPSETKQKYDRDMAEYTRITSMRAGKAEADAANLPQYVQDRAANNRYEAAFDSKALDAKLKENMEYAKVMTLDPTQSESLKLLAKMVLNTALSGGKNTPAAQTIENMFDLRFAGFHEDAAASRIAGNPAFMEIAEKLMTPNSALAAAMKGGDLKVLKDAVADVVNNHFVPAFKDNGLKQMASPEYQAKYEAEQAVKNAAKFVQPGRLESDMTVADRAANRDNAVAWSSVLGIYGSQTPFRTEWSKLSGKDVYTLEGWKALQSTNVSLDTMKPDGKQVSEKDFASVAMILAIRPENVAKIQDHTPTSVPFEDVFLSSNTFIPRADTSNAFEDVILPARRTAAECMSHMNEPVPGTNPPVTGKEQLAAELAKGLADFTNRMKVYPWTTSSHATACDVAVHALDFAKEHGMLDMLKQNGLTDDQLELLEFARAAAKVITEATNAEIDMLLEDKGDLTLPPQQRRECLDKLALRSALAADSEASMKSTEIGGQPVRDEARETEEQFTQRVMAWALEVANNMEKQDNAREITPAMLNLAHGGDMLQRMSNHLLPEAQREALSTQKNPEIYKMNCGEKRVVSSWAETIKNDAGTLARDRMEEQQVETFRKRLNTLGKNPENNAFVSAAQKVLATGSRESRMKLASMNDKQLDTFCKGMAKDSKIKLDDVLEGKARRNSMPAPTKQPTLQQKPVGRGMN